MTVGDLMELMDEIKGLEKELDELYSTQELYVSGVFESRINKLETIISILKSKGLDEF